MIAYTPQTIITATQRSRSLMLPFNRKSGTHRKEAWGEAKYDYEEAVKRCYRWRGVTLALCRFRKFVAFNFEYELKKKRQPFREDDWQFSGVVHEQEQDARHVWCQVKVLPGADADDYIGSFVLTHIGFSGDKTSRDEQALLLDVTLRDPTSVLTTSLIDGLRDAAVSGLQFMHIDLECPESTNEEWETALAQIRAQGYACMRKVLSIKMWPKIELQNSPKWSRRDD